MGFGLHWREGNVLDCHRDKPTSFAHAAFETSCQISGPFSSHVLYSTSYFFGSLHSLDETADVIAKFCGCHENLDPENSDPENSDPLKFKIFSILITQIHNGATF